MRILFSPIGTADPLSTLGDASMLHIVRHYGPDKIVLFLSPAMAQFQQEDARYTKAIELLSDALGKPVPEISLYESKNDQPHHYDSYIKEFDCLLDNLYREYPEAEIIVNVSSGTPAMGQALAAIDAFNRHHRLLAVQVSTPRKGINERDDRENPNDYDLDTLWSMYVECGWGVENRCHEIQSANFADLIMRDNIRVLVRDYDYVGAWSLAKDCASLPEEASKLIEGCVYRMQLNQQRAAECFKETDMPGPGDKLREYLATLEVYVAREQWVDYLRALTPALYETCFARVRMHVKDDAWTYEDWKTKTLRVDSAKVQADSELVKALPQVKALPRVKANHDPFVGSSQLCGLIKHYESSSEAEPYLRLRNMEESARNHVAHEITRVYKSKLEKEAKITFEESLSLLFKLNNTEPGLYARINERILELV